MEGWAGGHFVCFVYWLFVGGDESRGCLVRCWDWKVC